MGITVIIFLLIFAVWGIWTSIQITKGYENMLGGCNHDCNQSRQCDCVKRQQVRDDFDNDYWPFPIREKP